MQAYLDSYPSGRFLAQARTYLIAVKKAEAEMKPGKVFKDCPQCPEMVILPGGTFTMGGNDYPPDETPPHRVTIQNVAIGRAEVTQGQWKAVMGSNPSRFKQCGDECPVESVSWHDVQEFVQKLNATTGKRYRLPSEAEWEYAAKAGGAGKWGFGADESALGGYAWFAANSGGRTRPVAGMQANSFGLFDMHGNVWEWVEDCFHYGYVGAPSAGGAWTTACDTNTRVRRGGAWNNFPGNLRSVNRSSESSGNRAIDMGFRLARDL